jgi:hypothetical protein
MTKLIFLLIITSSLLLIPTILAPATSNEAPESVVESIILTTSENTISWKTNGYSSNGFKVIWSKTENPTYPTRTGDKYHYYSDSNKNTDTLTAFDGEGTYHARVCEYLGGKCGIYSNEIRIELSSEGEIKETKEKYEEVNQEIKQEMKQEETQEHKNNCNGCLSDEICYPLGHRVNGKFCANNLNLTNQTEENSKCENNFECKSNVCVSGECISEGLIKKILSWFRKFF